MLSVNVRNGGTVNSIRKKIQPLKRLLHLFWSCFFYFYLGLNSHLVIQNWYTLFCSVISKRGVDFGLVWSSRNKSLLPYLALFSARFSLNEAFFKATAKKACAHTYFV